MTTQSVETCSHILWYNVIQLVVWMTTFLCIEENIYLFGIIYSGGLW